MFEAVSFDLSTLQCDRFFAVIDCAMSACSACVYVDAVCVLIFSTQSHIINFIDCLEKCSAFFPSPIRLLTFVLVFCYICPSDYYS